LLYLIYLASSNLNGIITLIRKSNFGCQSPQQSQQEQLSLMISAAFATARATAMGSVQPNAGFTSRFTRAIISSPVIESGN
jgi:hypothetical protein